MRSLSLFCLSTLLLLAVGCDSVVDPEVFDDPAPLLPLDEGNYWIFDRFSPSTGVTAVDTLTNSATFMLNGEVWTHISGSSTLVECAAAYFTLREDGYHRSTTDPRISTQDVRLKYAYPAEVGTEYVIEPLQALVTGEMSWGLGTRTVTVIATDELVDTPYGEREAYRYRFTVETFFYDGEEIPVIDTFYDRVLVPEIGFVEFDTGFLTLIEGGSTATTASTIEWTLIDAEISPAR